MRNLLQTVASFLGTGPNSRSFSEDTKRYKKPIFVGPC